MNWILIGLLVTASVMVAPIFVAFAARLICWIPSPTVRRQLVIVGFTASFLLLTLIVVNVVLFPDRMLDLPRTILRIQAYIPSTVLLGLAPGAVLSISFAGLMIIGFRPQPGVPYRPRAASWEIYRMIKRVAIVLCGVTLVIWLNDIELKRQLAAMEARAEEIAASMKPPAVPERQNAAMHYQRIADLTKQAFPEGADHDYDEDIEILASSKKVTERTTEYFQRAMPIIECLREAAKCDQCSCDDAHAGLDFLDGDSTHRSVLSALKLLQTYAVYSVYQQRPRDALECVRVIRRWEDHLVQDPRNAKTVFFYYAEERVRQIIQVIVTDSSDFPTNDLRQCVAGPLPVEKIWRPITKWHAASVQKQLAILYDGRFHQRPDHAEEGAFAEPKLPGWIAYPTMRLIGARDDVASVEARFQCVEHPDDEASWDLVNKDHVLPEGYLHARLLMLPVLKSFLNKAEIQRQLSNIGIAAGIYRQVHGNWPTELSQLQTDVFPKVPLDPETNQPFSIKVIKDGLMVYAASEAKWFKDFEDTDGWWKEGADVIVPVLFLGSALEKLNDSKR